MNKLKRLGPKYTQRGCVTSSYSNAAEMLDYQFNGIGYVFWFGSYWAVYTA
jgi:hypothetical protein